MTEAGAPNAAVIRRTQDLLGKYVKKPVLSEKLLRKPPFRFLHDVINAVIQETGYLGQVYTADELVYENVKEKEAKIGFLQKLIDAVNTSSVDGAALKVRPSKIVAGHEPERTNELLQAIGRNIAAASAGQSNEKRRPRKLPTNKAEPKSSVNGGNQPAKTESVRKSTRTVNSSEVANEKRSSKKTSKPDKKTKTIKNERELPTTKQPPSIEKIIPETVPDKVEAIAPPASVSVTMEKSPAPEVPEPIAVVENRGPDPPPPFENVIQPTMPSARDELIDVIDQEAAVRRQIGEDRRQSSGHSSAAADPSAEIDPVESIATPERPQRSSRKTRDKPEAAQKVESASSAPKSSKKHRTKAETIAEQPAAAEEVAMPVERQPVADIQRPRTTLRPPSVRPASARPGAPRRRERNVEVFLPPDEGAPSQMPAAARAEDAFGMMDLDEDADNLIVIEDVTATSATATVQNGAIGETSAVPQEPEAGAALDGAGQAGHLVQQILQTQKEFTKGDRGGGGAENEVDFGTLQQRQSSATQMDTLRNSIQHLTRSVNPLGKLMDFLQEDIDAMQMELATWRTSYRTTKAELARERRENESAVVPLQLQLQQIEATIREHIALTNASKLNILQNEEKMLRLLSEI